ncbi:hypothetical protein [Couchioplanes azureus]|uniref:hypothetical protein n=1 Tax=Couchioplanes caeruleus TaxID=56438 RepID=UPI001E3F958A|nr:hypothetical protein [Couchioplanes caeruleus]
MLILVTLVGAAIGLSVASLRYRPAILTVSRDGGTFLAPVGASNILQGAAFVILGGATVIGKIRGIVDHGSSWPVDGVLAAMCILQVAVGWHLSRDRFGVRLRPDGVFDRQPLGSRFIPWDAFVPAFPVSPDGRGGLAAYYLRPDLVRCRGIFFGRETLAATVDPAFLTRVIHEYVNHPERRAAIGSAAELRRITAGTGH